MKLLVSGLAAGAITVLICTSRVGGVVRRFGERLHPRLGELLNCTFCTSWWVSIAMLNEYTIKEWAATVAIANLVVLGIHMSIATITGEDDVRMVPESKEA